MKRAIQFVAAALGAFVALPGWLAAQPVCAGGNARIVVPYPASASAIDGLGRALAQHLSQMWSQPVTVENRAGAGNVLGTQAVASAAPDGCTIGLATSALPINAALMPKRLPYDTLTDLVPVTRLASVPIGLFGSPNLPARNIPELVAYAKKQADGLTFGTPGVGSASHVAGAMLGSVAGIKLTHLPYKGGAAAAIDLMANRIDLMFTSMAIGVPHVKSGKLKLIAIVTPERDPAFPEVASIGESLSGYTFNSYFGVIAPKGMAPALVQRLSGDINKVMASADLKSKIDGYGLIATPPTTPERFGALVREDIERWGRIIRENGITAE